MKVDPEVRRVALELTDAHFQGREGTEGAQAAVFEAVLEVLTEEAKREPGIVEQVRARLRRQVRTAGKGSP